MPRTFKSDLNSTVASCSSSAVMHLSSTSKVNLFEITAQDRAPKKDFCQLIVTKHKVVFRRWVISLRVEAQSLRPLETTLSHEDFLDDGALQVEISRVFGAEALNKARCLCEGRVDWLVHMPLPILLYIISFLDIVDIANLSRVNTFFRDTCASDIIWEEMFFRHNDDVSEELIELGMERGWKEVFFSSKLHLRVLLNRRQRDKLQIEAEEKSHTRENKPRGLPRSSTPRVPTINGRSRGPLAINDRALNEASNVPQEDELLAADISFN